MSDLTICKECEAKLKPWVYSTSNFMQAHCCHCSKALKSGNGSLISQSDYEHAKNRHLEIASLDAEQRDTEADL